MVFGIGVVYLFFFVFLLLLLFLLNSSFFICKLSLFSFFLSNLDTQSFTSERDDPIEYIIIIIISIISLRNSTKKV